HFVVASDAVFTFSQNLSSGSTLGQLLRSSGLRRYPLIGLPELVRAQVAHGCGMTRSSSVGLPFFGYTGGYTALYIWSTLMSPNWSAWRMLIWCRSQPFLHQHP